MRVPITQKTRRFAPQGNLVEFLVGIRTESPTSNRILSRSAGRRRSHTRSAGSARFDRTALGSILSITR
jgi:hypothetical protein